MDNLLFLISTGIGLGCIYGCVALGLTCIFNGTQIINVAQGEFLMLGSVLSWLFVSNLGFPYLIGFFAAVFFSVVIGMLLNWLMVNPLLSKNMPHMIIVIGTYAFAMVVAAITGKLTNYQYLNVPQIGSLRAFKLIFFPIVPQYGVIILSTLILVIAYWVFVNHTRLGWAFTAASINRDMCKLLGINTGMMVLLAFSIGSLFCSIAGFLAGPLTNVSASMGFEYLIKGFVGAVFGGIANPYASVAGGISIGVLYVLIGGYFSPGHAELVTFALLLIILFVRPSGLFVGKE